MPFSTQKTSPSPTSRLGGGGLDYITSSTFTTASTVSVDGCFSSTYDNYRVVVRATGSTTIQSCATRLRVSGTDSSTGYRWYRVDSNSTVGGGGNTADTGANMVYVNSTYRSSWFIDFAFPAVAEITGMSWIGYRPDDYQSTGSCIHTVATAYDGFSIIPASGTITGSLAVYGYRKP